MHHLTKVAIGLSLVAASTTALASNFFYKHKIEGLSAPTQTAATETPEESVPQKMEPAIIFLDPVAGDGYLSYQERNEEYVYFTGRVEGAFTPGETIKAGGIYYLIEGKIQPDGSFSVPMPSYRVALYSMFPFVADISRTEADGSVSKYSSEQRVLTGLDLFDTPSQMSTQRLPDANYFASSTCSACDVKYLFDGASAPFPEAKLFERDFSSTFATWRTEEGVTKDYYAGINFGKQTPMRGFGISFFASGNKPTRVSFQVSNDGSSWSTVITKDTNVGQVFQDFIMDQTVSAQYARVYVHDSNSDPRSYSVIGEFVVYGNQIN